MAGNSFGTLFRFTTWGESHGPAIGVVVDGVPPRLALAEPDIQRWLDKRKPGQSRFTTQRREEDLVKILSGEQQWRNLTAMDKYYENGPLPSWMGWYVQQWPHSFHAGTAAFTLIAELLLAWLVFFPKWSKRIAFILTTLKSEISDLKCR